MKNQTSGMDILGDLIWIMRDLSNSDSTESGRSTESTGGREVWVWVLISVTSISHRTQSWVAVL